MMEKKYKIKDVSWVKTDTEPRINFYPSSCSPYDMYRFNTNAENLKDHYEETARKILGRMDVEYTGLVWTNETPGFLIENSNAGKEIDIILHEE